MIAARSSSIFASGFATFFPSRDGAVPWAASASTTVGTTVHYTVTVTNSGAGNAYGVSATDPLTFATVVVVTGLVAIAASVGPARRAGKTDPARVLGSS